VAATLNLSYQYQFESAVIREADSRKLRLATFGGVERNPYFFTGRFCSPKKTADLLLTLSEISRTRFYSPGLLRERMIAAADPVVTCDGQRLRFEVFSVCCGAYGRFDLQESGLAGDWISSGTTNVDFNPPMRAALSCVLDSENVGLRIGEDSVELERGAGAVIERKVKLPVRWLKGFVEVQAYQASLKPAMEVPALELLKVIRTLSQPNILQAGVVSYLVPQGRGLRISQRQAPGAVPVGAINRLKALEPILRHAQTVRIYSCSEATSAFELCLPNGSFHFVLSPEASRGFSGEGQALADLAKGSGAEILSKVKGALKWQDKLNPEELAHNLALDKEAVKNALVLLGSRGLVGFDLSEGAFFHRQLPFDLAIVEELHPRMHKARQLLEDGCVRLRSNRTDLIEASVRGSKSEHLVQITSDDFRCTCDWHNKHAGERGPCSHVLAAELAAQAGDEK